MKTTLISFIVALILNSQFFTSKIGFPIPFGTEEKIIKIKELPDETKYGLKDGTHYDLGSLYSIKRFLWLGYAYGEPKYVGYLNSQEKYAPLTAQELKNITHTAKIEIPELAPISFFDAYVSRILLLVILILIGFYGYKLYFRRKKILDARNQEELPSWPPSTSNQ